MQKILNFDMDGTIADLYAVEGWLEDLRNDKVEPYKKAKGCGNLSYLARLLNKIKRLGYEINIISWGSKDASEEYLERIKEAKIEWLRRHLKSVDFNNIFVISYGEPKSNCCGGILFDDSEEVRKSWKGISVDASVFSNITNYLELVIKEESV